MCLKDPKVKGALFLFPFFYQLLSKFYRLLLRGLERTRLHGQWTSLLWDTPISSDCACTPNLLVFCFSIYLIIPITLFMAPIPPSHRRGFQFRSEELDDFLEVVETYLPISAQNWQTVAGSHSENYPRDHYPASSRKYPVKLVPRVTPPAPPMSSRPRQLTGS